MASILVVDDRPTNRQFLLTLLGYGGHRLLEAADGEEALERIVAERPDLVITDILMPRLDGFQLVQRVRGDPAIAATRVMFYSAAYSVAEAEAMARTCGVATVLPKPCEPRVILDAVSRELGVEPSLPAAAPGPPAGAPGHEDRHGIGTHIAACLEDLDATREFMGRAMDSGRMSPEEREDFRTVSVRVAENLTSLQLLTTRLGALETLSLRLIAEREPRPMMELFVDMASRILGASQAAMGVLDDTESAVEHLVAKGLDAERLRTEALDRRRLPGRLLSADRPLRFAAADAASHPFPRGHPQRTSFLGLPIRRETRLYGWLYFAGKQGADAFTGDDERLAEAMAAQFALVHENLALYRSLRRHAGELRVAAIEQERVQQALAGESVRRRVLFEKARDGVFVVDGAGRIVEANRSFAAMLRCTHEEVLEARAADWNAIYEAPFAGAGGQSLQGTFETRITRADGSAFDAEISYNVAAWEGGRLHFNVCRDVTERKRDERALVASAGELRSLSRRLANSEEFERRRIAQELHDRIGGAITALNLNLAILQGELPAGREKDLGRRLDDSRALLGETTAAVRELMADLRPPVLDDYGLAAALRWHGEQFGKRAGLKVSVTTDVEGERLAPEREIGLFRIAQEALTNAGKHSGAASARVSLEHDAGLLRLTIADGGAGFEPAAGKAAGAAPSWGLVNMRERAESIGGRLTIDSAPGQGTRVIVELPT